MKDRQADVGDHIDAGPSQRRVDADLQRVQLLLAAVGQALANEAGHGNAAREADLAAREVGS
jgi:hypothetical protein